MARHEPGRAKHGPLKRVMLGSESPARGPSPARHGTAQAWAGTSQARPQGPRDLCKLSRTSPPASASRWPSSTSFGTARSSAPATTLRPRLSRPQRHPIRVAYQGVRGSYCQEAAAEAYPSSSHPPFLPCPHIKAAFAALEDGFADRAIVPFKNSLDSPIPHNLDLLLCHSAVHIVGELLLPVNHYLLSLPGAPRSALRRIVSHPQALDHCCHCLQALDLVVSSAPMPPELWCYLEF